MPLPRRGRGDGVPGGVIDHGTHDMDGQVTREAPDPPSGTRRAIVRSPGLPMLRRAAAFAGHARPTKKKHSHRG